MKKLVLIIFINVVLFSLTACHNIDNMCDIVGHYYKDIVISPTCEKEGYTLHQCEDCSYSYIDAEKKALGHNIIEVEEVFPTCNNEGNSAGTKCSRCNDKNEYTIYPALGHNMIIDSRVEPTCTETGFTEGSHCSRCDHVIVQEVIAALGHNYTAVVTKPTCESDGYTTHTCDRCDDEYVDSYADALGHDMITDSRVEPTCTETGLTEGSHCSRCNFKIEQEIIPELGHIEEVTIQGLVPTNEKSGLSEQIECSVCNEILQEQILLPAKGYDWIIEDNEIKILLVGNSYTEDATSCAQGPIDNSPLFSIIQSMVGEDIKVTIGVIISGGKGMNWHATKAENNTTAYYFKTINSETKVWSSSKSMTMKNALTYTNWDMISLQPYSVNTSTGIESNAYPNETNSKFLHIKDSSAYLLDYVHQYAPQAEVYLYMHWAQTSAIQMNAALSKYNSMANFFPSILEYQGEKTGKRFTTLIPVGLSIQNARTTYLSLLAYNTTAYADKNLNYTTDAQIGLQRDGGHVSFNVGRYIASLTFAEQIIPESLRVLEYILPDIRYTESIGQLPKEYTEIAQLSVFAAIESWKNGDLGVTNIDGYAIDPIKLAKTNLEQLTLYLDNCTEEEFVKKLNYLIINELSSEYVIDRIEINHVDGFVTFKLRFGYMSETITLSYDVNKNGHNLIIDEKVEPTCITTGLTEGSHCTRCSYKIDQEIIDIIDHVYENGLCKCCNMVNPDLNSLNGKTVSILGDSISTYIGVSDDSSVNSTLKGGNIYYTEGRWGVYRKDTWWQQVIDALGMKLLVNNSWSGSCVLHTRNNAPGAYINRCCQLHNEFTNEEPDIILIFISANDFSYFQDKLGDSNIDYSNLIIKNNDGSYSYKTPTTSCEAYAIMLHKITNRYQNAKVYCLTSLVRRYPDYNDNYADVGQPTEFNKNLINIAKNLNCEVIDLEKCGINKEADIFDKYIADKRTHPNPLGMDEISKVVCSALINSDVNICKVDYKVSNVTLESNVNSAIINNSYHNKIILPESNTLSNLLVTMNGIDITSSAYNNNEINISKVTGDILIEIIANRPFLNFAWTLENNNLISTGEALNTATQIAGSIDDGVINNGQFSLENNIVLKHDVNWVIEFTFAYDWRGVIFSDNSNPRTHGMLYLTRTNGGNLCFGTYDGSSYQNYGVTLSILDNDPHKFSLVNEVSNEGNMIYLYIDGEKIGAMDNYFIGSTSQNITSNWVNGKDFIFSFIGMDNHALRDCKFESLYVYENGK